MRTFTDYHCYFYISIIIPLKIYTRWAMQWRDSRLHSILHSPVARVEVIVFFSIPCASVACLRAVSPMQRPIGFQILFTWPWWCFLFWFCLLSTCCWPFATAATFSNNSLFWLSFFTGCYYIGWCCNIKTKAVFVAMKCESYYISLFGFQTLKFRVSNWFHWVVKIINERQQKNP